MVKQTQHCAHVVENLLSGATLQQPVTEVQKGVDSLLPEICQDHRHAFGEDQWAEERPNGRTVH